MWVVIDHVFARGIILNSVFPFFESQWRLVIKCIGFTTKRIGLHNDEKLWERTARALPGRTKWCWQGGHLSYCACGGMKATVAEN